MSIGDSAAEIVLSKVFFLFFLFTVTEKYFKFKAGKCDTSFKFENNFYFLLWFRIDNYCAIGYFTPGFLLLPFRLIGSPFHSLRKSKLYSKRSLFLYLISLN